MIYAIIPVLNRWNYTYKCIKSLSDQTPTSNPLKIVVIDHGSSDGTKENIKKYFPNVTILEGSLDMWWAGATNLGIKYIMNISNDIHNDLILTINNDVTVDNNFVLNIFNDFKENSPCLIGSTTVDFFNKDKLIYCGSKWNRYTAKFTSIAKTKYSNSYKSLEAHNISRVIESDMLPGRGVLIPLKLFYEIGLYDDNYFPHYAADDDFSIRAKNRNYKLFVSSKAVVYELSQVNTQIHKLGSFLSIIECFSSLKSPLNLKVRLRWALKHSPIGIIYFIFDILRLFFSKIKLLFIYR
ncbi:glycosyltransferase family 2 protein [Telluribacter sp. SYSU D00476]|uniref:glycosyltransferase family 2 protein n=1 Tax=Telluribacter sp. SYSU D00476 TaxID=2811430 RepID=UPI0021D45A79|nr:glycosyltransferase family 2 protein [Telluribacter sp. SYSU D00476]